MRFRLLLVCLTVVVGGAQARPASTEGRLDPAKRVAVLVHGFQGLAGNDYRCSDGAIGDHQAAPRANASPAQLHEFDRLAQTLRDAGFTLYFARWTTSARRTITIEQAAMCLRDQVRAVKEREGVPGVTLVAHSMGGVVSRAYVEGESYAGDVDRLITFGAPHLGIAPVTWIKVLSVIMPLAAPCEVHPGICQLAAGDMATFNEGHPPRDGVSYYRVGGNGAWWFTNWIYGFQPNDGLVLRKSSIDLRLGGWRTGDSHGKLPFKVPFTAPSYDESRESVACLKSFLDAGRGSAGCRMVPARPVSLQAAGPSHADASVSTLSYARSHSGDLGPGQTTRLPVALDGLSAGLVLTWDGGYLRFDLRTPSGVVVTAAEVSQGLAGATYREALLPHGRYVGMYTLPSPAAGRWEMVLSEQAGQPAAYGLQVGMHSPIRVTLEAPTSVAPGERFTVRARLSEDGAGLTGATAEAKLLVTDAAEGSPMREIAAGVYETELIAPPATGPIQISVAATGSSRAGVRYERQVDSILAVDAVAPSPTMTPSVLFIPYAVLP